MPKVLTPEQIEHYIERGWVRVDEAFPRGQAAAVQDFLWNKLAERGIDRNESSTWHNPMEFIAENFNTPPFDGCATKRLADACADIVGDERWVAQHEIGWWGWWPINFGVGADQPWDVPADEWHIDTPGEGTYVTAPDQGALVICLFSSLEKRGGGTLVLEGSHRMVARFLAESPHLSQNETNDHLRRYNDYMRELCGIDAESAPGTDTGNARGIHVGDVRSEGDKDSVTPRIEKFMNRTHVEGDGLELRVVEITGEPGDVVIGHPFLFHSPSFNHSGRPRFMCNRKTPLAEPLKLEREDGDYSPLEESMRRALDGEKRVATPV